MYPGVKKRAKDSAVVRASSGAPQAWRLSSTVCASSSFACAAASLVVVSLLPASPLPPDEPLPPSLPVHHHWPRPPPLAPLLLLLSSSWLLVRVNGMLACTSYLAWHEVSLARSLTRNRRRLIAIVERQLRGRALASFQGTLTHTYPTHTLVRVAFISLSNMPISRCGPILAPSIRSRSRSTATTNRSHDECLVEHEQQQRRCLLC